jgi:hypothetical protein
MAIIKNNRYKRAAHTQATLYKGQSSTTGSTVKLGAIQKAQPTLVAFTYPLPIAWHKRTLAHSITCTLSTTQQGVHDSETRAWIRATIQEAYSTWKDKVITQAAQWTDSASFMLPFPAMWATMKRKDKQATLQAAYDTINSMLPWMVWEVPNPRYPGQILTLDADQCYAVAWFLWSGSSFVLTGPAGSGKTLLLQAIAIAWARKNPELRYEYKLPVHMRTSQKDTHKLGPAMYIGSFTNKAVGVLRQKVLASAELAYAGFGPNMMSLHGLCEFEPVEVESTTEDGQPRLSRQFMPGRTKCNPLVGLSCAVLDEASMIGVGVANEDTGEDELAARQIWSYFYDALSPEQGTQVVLVGDINQLPPVGGKSILSYGLNQLPVIELTFFHRQAAESPIIAAAHSILRGEFPQAAKNESTGDEFAVICWQQKNQAKYGSPKPDKNTAALVHGEYLAKCIKVLLDRDEFTPGEDIFLIPMYKEDNTHILARLKRQQREGKISLAAARYEYQEYVNAKTANAIIASELAYRHDRLVYAIYAGGTKAKQTLYLAEGDRVLVNKIEGVVVGIADNPAYSGKTPPHAKSGKHINYFGHKLQSTGASAGAYELASDSEAIFELETIDQSDADEAYEALMQARTGSASESEAELAEAAEAKVRQASHTVSIELDTGELICISSVGSFADSNFQLGYALTVHKAQGSEWNRVFVLLHATHNIMASRELVYTAITRARNRCALLGDLSIYQDAIQRPRLKGNSLAEKIACFNEGDLRTIDMSKIKLADEAIECAA